MALRDIAIAITGDASSAVNAFRQTSSAARQTGDDVRSSSGRMAAGAAEAQGGMGRMAEIADELKGRLGRLAAGFTLAAVIKESLEAALAMERLTKLFNAAAGSASLGGREFEYIRQVSNRLGLDVQSTAESYGKFMASIKGTTLEGDKGRRVFESVAEASTALGLSTETTNRMFVAMQQMMSKGKVSSEELSQQLGENLPNALGFAASAMGVSKAQLMDMMQKGELMADDLLPRLADQLHATYGQAAMEGANSGQAALNRFKNELFETKAALGNALMPALQGVVGFITPMVTKLREFIGGIQILAVKAAAALDRSRIGMYGGSKSSDYQQRLANSRQAEEEAIADIIKRNSGSGSTDYTAAERARQASNKASTPVTSDKAAKAAQRAAAQAQQAAENWRKTYADLQTEIDKLNPVMDEHGQKVVDVTNKYDDLMHKKGADVSRLQALKTAMLDAIEVRKQMDEAIAQNKVEMDEYKVSADAMDAADKAHWLEVANTIKTIEGLQPGAGLDSLNKQIEQFQEIARQFPDMASQVAAAIAKLQLDYANSSGVTEMLKDISDTKIDLISDEFQRQQAVIDREYNAKKAAYEKELKLVEKTGKKRSDIEEALAVAKQKHDQDTAKNNEASYKAQISNVANYAGAGAALFSELANAQDQSSRKGFEAAKAFSYAAAIMATAQAVMVALASPGNIYSNMAMAAVAAAIGAIQVAQIEKTKYGGGGSVVAPSGSFNAGSGASSLGSTSGIGSMIGTQYGSVYDQQTQESLQALAASADSASLAIGRVADGLTDIASLFEDENSYLSLATSGLSSGKLDTPDTVMDVITDVVLETSKLSLNQLNLMTDLFNGKIFSTFNNMVSGINDAIFGGSWYTKSAGIALSLEGEDATAYDYLRKKKNGGIFGKSKEKYSYTEDAAWTDIIQTTVDSITSTIAHAAVAMGTSADLQSAYVERTRIKTTGRSEEDIAKDLQAWLENASNALAKTVNGLKAYTFYNENAFDALVRLSTALQSTNESFELIGASLIDSTLAGANAAYKLQQLMGGSEEFADAIDTYFSSMFTDAQQEAMTAAQAARQVSTAFAEMGLSVPQTRAGFVSLVDSLDLSTESGAATFAALMDISEAFATMTKAAESSAESLQTAFIDNALSAAGALKDILGGTLSTLTPQQILMQQQATWAAAVAQNNAAALPELAKTYLESARNMFGSGIGYSNIYATVTRTLADVAGISGDITLDSVTRQIAAIQKVQDAISNGTNAMVASIAELRAEISALRKSADENAAKIVNATDNSADSISGTLSAVARA